MRQKTSMRHFRCEISMLRMNDIIIAILHWRPINLSPDVTRSIRTARAERENECAVKDTAARFADPRESLACVRRPVSWVVPAEEVPADTWRQLHRSIGQTWPGSFSAVSKPNFASNYAFESSRRDLHNAFLCTALQYHFFNQKVPNMFAKFCKKQQI